MKQNPQSQDNPLQYQNPQYPVSPGQFQPTPYFPTPLNNGPQKPPHNYRGWVLAIFIIGYVFAWIAYAVEYIATSGIPSPTGSSSSGALSAFAIILFIAVNIGILLVDARSFLSLYGRIRWRYLKGWQKIGLGILYLGAGFMPAIYLLFALQYFRKTTQQTVTGTLRQWYRSKSSNARITTILVSTLVVICFIATTFSMAAFDRNQAYLALTPTAAPQQVAQVSNPTASSATQNKGATGTVAITPTTIPAVTKTPKPVPTPKPSPIATHVPQPTPKPTQPPTPTPCPGVNCNPWGFNFTPGNFITNPPSDFCDYSYFTCIPTFWNGNGYVEECQDGEYSLSGGIQGSCSHHGGDLRPLYSH